MKILYLSTLDIMGGAARGAYRLHRGLLARGIDSTMLAMEKFSDDPTVMGPRSPWDLRLWRLRNDLSRRIIRLQRSPNPIAKSINLFPTGTARRVNEFGADIVQLHWIGSEMISIPEVAAIKAPIVWRLADQWAFCGSEHYTLPGQDARYREGYTSENRPARYEGPDIERWTWKRKMRHWRDKPMTIVTGSRWLADCARKSALFSNKRVEAVPSGIDVSIYRPLGRDTAREILNLPKDKIFILFGALSATSDPRKGYHLLVEALRAVAAKRGDVEGLVLGASRPATPPDVGMKLTYIPKLSDDWSLALVYSAADVLAAPSTQDNLPFSVMEAQSCGVPCVAFNIGGMPDMIEDGVNGVLAHPFDTGELAGGLLAILGDGQKRREMGEKSREKALKEYDVAVQAERYEKIYREILAEAGR